MARYTGAPMGNPNSRHLGTWTGHLSHQSKDLQAGIASLRKGLRSHEDGYVPMPIGRITLTMKGFRLIRGNIQGVSVASTRDDNPHNPSHTTFIMTMWDKFNRLQWAIVNIRGDNIEVRVTRNPVDMSKRWALRHPRTAGRQLLYRFKTGHRMVI